MEELKKMQMTGAGQGLSILESVDGQKWKNVESSFESFTTILNGQHGITAAALSTSKVKQSKVLFHLRNFQWP